MVNPGSFSGTRKEFITLQKPLYAAAVTENHVADTVADIQRRYFKRYPISLPHTEEPSDGWLEQVDDNSPDPELLPPDQTVLDDEAFKEAHAAYVGQVKLLKFRKEQIARRLAYQHAKDEVSPKHISIGSEDPMVIMMAKLTGIAIKKPRMRTGYNVWGQNNRQVVDAIFDERVKLGNVPATKRAALRMQIYKEFFEKLSAEERRDYERRAVEEHRVAIEGIEKALNSPPSQNPADRQQILKGLPNFVQPILDLIADYTGWKATLLVGGPEPADQGRLNMMSFHAGETIGNIKMNFGRSERRGYKGFVMPIFGTFLKKCYTVEDCRAAALTDSATASLSEVLQLDGGSSFTIESVDNAMSYVKVARMPSENRELNEAGLPSQMPSLNPPQTLTALPQPQTRPSSAPPLREHVSPTSTLRNSMENGGTARVGSPVPSPAPSPCASPSPPSPAVMPELPPMAPVPQSLVPRYSSASLEPTLHALSAHAMPAQSPRTLQVPPPNVSPMRSSRASQGPPPATPIQSPQFPISPEAPLSDVSPIDASHIPAQLSPSLRPNVKQQVLQKRHHAGGESEDESPTKVDTPLRKRLRSSKMGIGLVQDSYAAGAVQEKESASRSTRTVSTIAHTSIPPLTPTQLAGSPDWFLKAYQMLLSKDLGSSWIDLIRLWAHFEQKSHYEEQEKLGAAGQPPCVKGWISRARSTTYKPDLGALPLFEKSFGSWWTGLQPEWRRDGSDGVLKRQSGDLEVLRRPGKNGLVSVLAALFFWGVDADKKGNVDWQKRWKEATEDVYWVIQGLNTSGEST